MFTQSQLQRLAIAFGAISASAIAQVATFRSLGHLRVGSQDSRAIAISADGQVVVGFSGSRAFRWSALDGMTDLGELSPEYATSSATDLSSDGTVIIGSACVAGFDCDPFLWTAGSGYTFVGGMSEGFLPYAARGVSDDGTIVVGGATSSSNPHERAYRWTVETGAVAIQPSDTSTSFYDISADGTTAVGFITGPIGWTAELGIFSLGSLGGGGKALCASANGSVIAGECASDLGIEAFRWTAETGMVGLGDFAGGFYLSSMYDMSADGEILVGFATNAFGSEAAIWNRYHGLRSLRTTLNNIFGIDLTEWALRRAYGVSADGRSIVGYGVSPSGHDEAWMVTLPRPCPADVARNFVVDLGDLTRLLSNFGLLSGAIHANGDVDLDGDVDFYDLTELLGEFGSICE